MDIMTAQIITETVSKRVLPTGNCNRQQHSLAANTYSQQEEIDFGRSLRGVLE